MKRTSARIYRGTARNLQFLASRLRAGELVAVPTETVYGLAANAFDVQAVRKIFKAKNRPASDPLIIHLHSAALLETVCRPNESAHKLAHAFWPGPLTLVLPKTAAVSDSVTAGQKSVAVRVPAHPLFRRLLKLADLPLAAPSANPFGYVSPTTADHVLCGLGRRIAHILDGGASSIGLESTILDLRDESTPRLLRPGAITREAIENVLGLPVAVPRKRASSGRAQLAPGMLTRHYSPKTLVILHNRMPPPSMANEAYVYLSKPRGRTPKNVFWLDPRGKLSGVARQLFATLRELDGGRYRIIHVEKATGGGLADAINDRLRRAAAR